MRGSVFSPLFASQLPSEVANCKVVGYASGVGLLPTDKGVGTGPAATQVGPACAQTRLGLPGTCLQQAELF